jgi:dolichol kinase
MNRDWMALILSFVYVFTMIGVAEGLRRWRGYSVEFTRKFIHIAVGMWAYGTVLLFERRTFAIIPPLAFVLINAFSYWRGTFRSMETTDRKQLGTIYFPISFAAIIWFLWGQPALLVASLMPMTWGDALAAIVGQRVGVRFYRVADNSRTLEGSLVMFVASTATTLAALLLLAAGGSWGMLLLAATITGLAATVVEALSPWGIDNLTVPTVSAVMLVFLLQRLTLSAGA